MKEEIIKAIGLEHLMIILSSSLGWFTSYVFWLYKWNKSSIKLAFINIYLWWFIGTLASFFSSNIYFCTVVALFAVKIMEVLEKNIPLIIEKKLQDTNLINKNATKEDIPSSWAVSDTETTSEK